MAATPPPAPAPGDGALPFTNSSPSLSHPSVILPTEDDHEGSRLVAGDNGEVAEQRFAGGTHIERSDPGRSGPARSKNYRNRKHKVICRSFAQFLVLVHSLLNSQKHDVDSENYYQTRKFSVQFSVEFSKIAKYPMEFGTVVFFSKCA
jgi:hypothetical protein